MLMSPVLMLPLFTLLLARLPALTFLPPALPARLPSSDRFAPDTEFCAMRPPLLRAPPGGAAKLKSELATRVNAAHASNTLHNLDAVSNENLMSGLRLRGAGFKRGLVRERDLVGPARWRKHKRGCIDL